MHSTRVCDGLLGAVSCSWREGQLGGGGTAHHRFAEGGGPIGAVLKRTQPEWRTLGLGLEALGGS